jgi:hypothetical protein
MSRNGLSKRGRFLATSIDNEQATAIGFVRAERDIGTEEMDGLGVLGSTAEGLIGILQAQGDAHVERSPGCAKRMNAVQDAVTVCMVDCIFEYRGRVKCRRSF